MTEQDNNMVMSFEEVKKYYELELEKLQKFLDGWVEIDGSEDIIVAEVSRFKFYLIELTAIGINLKLQTQFNDKELLLKILNQMVGHIEGLVKKQKDAKWWVEAGKRLDDKMQEIKADIKG